MFNIFKKDLQRDFSCLMIGHLKNKPSIERIVEAINDAAKIEFDFILNGLNIDLVEIEPEEVIQLIDRNYQQFQDLINNNTSISVSYNADILYTEPRVDGIEIDRRIINRVRLKNTFGSYNLSNKPITVMEQDWEKGPESWNYTYPLQPANNYLRIDTVNILNSDRNIVLFVDDTLNKWKQGQSFKISFGGAGVDVDNSYGIFRFFVLTDAENISKLSSPYSIQVTSITSGEFEDAGGKPMFELICISTNPLQFSVERLR